MIQTSTTHSHWIYTRYITLHAHWISPRVSTPLQIRALSPFRNMPSTHEQQLFVHAGLPHSPNQALLACVNTMTSLSMFLHGHLRRPVPHAQSPFPTPTPRIPVLVVFFTFSSIRTPSLSDGMIYKHHSQRFDTNNYILPLSTLSPWRTQLPRETRSDQASLSLPPTPTPLRREQTRSSILPLHYALLGWYSSTSITSMYHDTYFPPDHDTLNDTVA